MSKKPASDKQLSALHEALATVIAAQVQETLVELDDAGNPVSEVYSATPALLTVAARFLKDNDITCTVEDSKGLTELADELASRRKRRDNIKSLEHLSKDEANA